MFTLAHISDPHLGPLPPVRARDLMNKRFFGWLSWMRRRQGIHRPEVLTALAEDLGARAPDHLVVTGDLTNIALLEEFSRVAEWLHGLGTPEAVTVIPGNHDAYVTLPWEASLAKWQPFMTCEAGAGENAGADAEAQSGPEAFPFVRYRGPAAIIGLSSAQATPLFCAHGTLGTAQLERLRSLLQRLGEQGWFRVVLLHHPPSLDRIAWRKRLVDAVPFREVIAEAGAELILHGHDHSFGAEQIAGPDAGVPVIGVPSASAGRESKHPIAHYQLYDIEQAGNGWRIGVRSRGFDPASGSFREARSYDL
ncbi:metallophosphoesterase family protein [Pelagibius marinus]|uniref:metallophosphoesterase family protein n=1 Tax=Pelagibius marinus TaxID=2762760 RepID=UPI001872A6D0|nr:metallophosphoesterase [Pelagibius marinus]